MQFKLLMAMIPILGFAFHASGQGDLLITPTRVVFDGNKQKEELNLVNIGKDTAIYTISFIQYDMKEDGSFLPVEKTDSGRMFADPYLRIFPRKVTLAPREPQVISLQCRRRPEMAPGEYRSHLYFRAEKNLNQLNLDSQKTDSSQLKVQLIPIYGISIPIIIRAGSVQVSATLSDLKLENKQDSVQSLKLTINRTGNISVYGDFSIEFVPVSGKSFEVGNVKGVGVYTNINKRTINIKLARKTDAMLTNGKLKVKYFSNEPNKAPVTIAEAQLEL